MTNDEQTLRDLNHRIGDAEAAGDVSFLADLVASRLAFRRADGVCNDREEFLSAVHRSDARKTEGIKVEVFGRDRALVQCVVTTTNGRYHNLRLFVRDRFGAWKLLGWANEKMNKD